VEDQNTQVRKPIRVPPPHPDQAGSAALSAWTLR
jgi:hypothetical protein